MQKEIEKQISEISLKIKDTTANPSPLGLMAFGMTTVLLNLNNAGIFALGAMILSMGIFYGGLAQVIAGIMEWKKNNTFGTVAFLSFGFFWLSRITLIVMPKMGWAAAPEASAMVAYFSIWGLFTLIMFIGTLKISRALQVVFATLTLLFILLALREATGNATIAIIAGYVGIICGFSAIYTSLAQMWNEIYGKSIVPIGSVK